MALRLAAAVGAFAAVAAAQAGGPAPADLATRLHEAWLCEVLDLDAPGAIAAYESIAADRSGRIERWVAVARLAEWQRLGAKVERPGPVAEAPPAVRAALALLTPLPLAELLQSTPPGQAEAARILDLRPATLATVTWVRNQSGPSQSERQRQRAASGRPRTPPNRNDAERIARQHATDIVLRELEGKTEQAAGLRGIYFPDWKPPTPADAAAAAARAKAHLDDWLQEADLSPPQQSLLGRLRAEFDQRAAADAAGAVAWLQRMPVFADRLLAAPAPK